MSDRVIQRTVDSIYGITTTGFSRMRFPEIRETIINSLQTRTGLIFETRPDSITGQFIDTFAERETALWELCEAVYFAMYPISSFGTNLDHSVSFAGVIRLFEEKSRVLAVMYGTEGTLITAGSVVKEQVYRNSFLLQVDTTISVLSAVDVSFTVDSVIAGDVLTVSVNGVLYSYTVGITDDIFMAAAGLSIALTGSGPAVSTSANSIRLVVIEFVPFAVVLFGNMTFTIIGSAGNFVAENYGPIETLANSLNVIVTTQTGWNSVNNLVPGSTGRNDETDDELRRRYQWGVFRLGAATIESIDANLRQNVSGLLALKVFENVDDIIDADGRVPHCIEVVAMGGDAQEIGTQLYLLKAAGIDTFGTTQVDVTDSSGMIHPIFFNRPEQVYIWVNVIVTLYDEEVFPANGAEQIQETIVTTGNLFGIDKDVILQRFHGPIYSTIRGIESLTISVAAELTPGAIPPPGNYFTNTVPIGGRQLSRFDTSRVSVTVLP